MKAKLVSLVVLLLCGAISYGQNAHSYELVSRDGHFYFTADICGERSEVMVESGIPALLVGLEFYERSLAGVDLVVEPSKARIRLLNNVYEIAYKTDGELQIGQDRYRGPIFILKDFDGISLPIQNLYGDSGHRTVSVDILKGWLTIGEAVENRGKCYRLRLDKETGFPVVKGEVAISFLDKTAVLKGGLIVDFGNPMPVFLMSGHKSVRKAVKKGNLQPQDALDADGNVVAQGVYAEVATICGQAFKDVSVGLTGKMTSIKEMGFLGLPFFKSAVAFDFDKGKMFVL